MTRRGLMEKTLQKQNYQQKRHTAVISHFSSVGFTPPSYQHPNSFEGSPFSHLALSWREMVSASPGGN